MIRGVVFDLDGVLVESEEYWDEARRSFVAAQGGQWTERDQRAVMGHNTREWARYIREHFGRALDETTIAAAVIDRMIERYRQRLPVLPGAVTAVRRLAAIYPLGLASSSPLRLIEFVLDRLGIRACFRAIVSSDEVNHGKPAPDVYLLACRRLGVAPAECVAIEDSANGIRAAVAAGLHVIAIPNRRYPPDPAILRTADLVLASIDQLRPDRLSGWPSRRPRTGGDSGARGERSDP